MLIEDGIGGHILELESVAQSSGLILGLLGLASALVANDTVENSRDRALQAVALTINVLLATPGALLLAYFLSKY